METKNNIKADFGVESISKKDNESLYFKADHLFHKFVWNNEVGSTDELKQFYLLRYELAHYLKTYVDSNASKNTFTLSSGEEISFEENIDQLKIHLKTHFSDTVFDILAETELIKTLLSDLELLNTTIKDLDSAAKNRITSKLIEDPMKIQGVENKLTDRDFEIMQFESALSKGRSRYDLASIYKVLLNENLTKTRRLTSYLLDDFDYFYTTESCDCGNIVCPFDMLKENQMYFFNNDYYDQYGDVDPEKVENDFNNMWPTLSLKKKAILFYLSFEFQNTTLLNIGLLRPNFSLTHYQFLMGYPYEPNSTDEIRLIEVSTLSNFFVKFDS
ncbi:MAG TPA: hypothetical protein VFD77_04965 [Brumimicrobium sp.]|nr:hypothetical protein [Brumimicrobium sp.]